MLNDFIPVNQPLLSGNESKYLQECISSGWISSEGPFVSRFEREMASFVGRKHAIAVSNGSAALDASICALGISEGDEVILPSFTIISCVSQILRCGAIPIFVDADPLTWNMDILSIETKITNKTKAIMAVHIYGLPVDMDPILTLAKKYGLFLIEDAAEAIGQTYKNRPCGSFGDVSTFSFYPNKHITTGEGGMILTDSDQLAASCRSLRNLCFKSSQRFVHDSLGWNLRMTNLQAALGVAQLEKIEYHIQRKLEIGHLYNNLLSDVPDVQLPQKSTDYASNLYWVYGLIHLSLPAVHITRALADRGIGTRPFFYPLHLQPLMKGYPFPSTERLPISERLSAYGFYLPSGLGHTDAQIIKAAETLKTVLLSSSYSHETPY